MVALPLGVAQGQVDVEGLVDGGITALDADLVSDESLDAVPVASLALDAGLSASLVLVDADLVIRLLRYKSRGGAFGCFFPDANINTKS